MSDLENKFRRCVNVKDGEVGVCVIPMEDLGRNIITVDSGKNVESFERTDEAIKYLKKLGVPREEREEVIEFLSHNLRPAEMLYDLSEKGGRIEPIGLNFKKEKLRL